jgi:hypothetical protein
MPNCSFRTVFKIKNPCFHVGNMCYEHEIYLALLISHSQLLFLNVLLEIINVVIDYLRDYVTVVFF